MNIDEEMIKNRMEVLVEDVKSVRERIANAERQIMDDKATLNALLGAYQQCEAFLKEINDETSDEE
jgi:type I site-specific restriction endonuclease